MGAGRISMFYDRFPKAKATIWNCGNLSLFCEKHAEISVVLNVGGEIQLERAGNGPLQPKRQAVMSPRSVWGEGGLEAVVQEVVQIRSDREAAGRTAAASRRPGSGGDIPASGPGPDAGTPRWRTNAIREIWLVPLYMR